MIKPATYQGKPCQHGHGATRYRSNYKCVTCARAESRAAYDKTTATARKRAYRAKRKES